ncbi:MAG: hypothetical protein JNN15_19535 [Blastocatellia bacterium]|nr:hypothetical protein [Blastocatellia bacterium]
MEKRRRAEARGGDKELEGASKTEAEPSPSLRIYCPVFNHFKNTIVCSLCCPIREKCSDFQQFYRVNREAQENAVSNYIESHRRLPPSSLLTIQYRLEVLKKMSDTYVWIGQDDKAQVMTLEEVIQAAEDGGKPKHIFLTKQELVLRYQLVPKTRREETRRDDGSKAVVGEQNETLEAPEPTDLQERTKRRQGRAVA